MNKILTLTIIGILTLIICVTIFQFAENKSKPGDDLRKPEQEIGKIENLNKKRGDKVQAFTNIGTLRAMTKPQNYNSTATVILVTPWFSYPQGDTVLYEELCQKEVKFRTLILSYFSQFTEDQLRSRGEPKIKEDLLNQINASLVLGKIKGVYFDEYVFLN